MNFYDFVERVCEPEPQARVYSLLLYQFLTNSQFEFSTCRKKKRKVKSLKKKKKKKKNATRSKVHYHSKRSSSSSVTSSESSSGSESSSDFSDEWVEKNTQGHCKTQKDHHTKHFKQGDSPGDNLGRPDALLQDCSAHKDTKRHFSNSRAEASQDESPRLDKEKAKEITRRSHASPSVKRKKRKHQEDAWGKGSREHVAPDLYLSHGKQSTSVKHQMKTENATDSKRMKSTWMTDDETFHSRELKRIRSGNIKDPEMCQASIGCHDNKVRTVNEKSRVPVAQNYNAHLCTQKQFHARQSKGQSSKAVFASNNCNAGNSDTGRLGELSKSLGSQEKGGGTVKDNRSLLVSYDDSSDD